MDEQTGGGDGEQAVGQTDRKTDTDTDTQAVTKRVTQRSRWDMLRCGRLVKRAQCS